MFGHALISVPTHVTVTSSCAMSSDLAESTMQLRDASRRSYQRWRLDTRCYMYFHGLRIFRVAGLLRVLTYC